MRLNSKTAGYLPRFTPEEGVPHMARPERSSRRERPAAAEQKPIKSIAGRVGGDPEEKTAGDSDIVEFSVAVPNGYGDDAPPPTWIQVTVWDRKPELQDWVLDEIYKGSAVAVEGTYSTNPGNDGKTYHKINAVKIGLIEWFKADAVAPSKRSEPAAAPARGRRESAPPQDDLDDLPF